MSLAEQPPVGSAAGRRFGDDLDGLLRAFFRSEAPEPWPACPTPSAHTIPATPRVERSRWALARSRFALAASVAVLVAGLWGVGGRLAYTPEPAGSGQGSPTAGRVDVKEMIDVEGDNSSFRVIVSPQRPK